MSAGGPDLSFGECQQTTAPVSRTPQEMVPTLTEVYLPGGGIFPREPSFFQQTAAPVLRMPQERPPPALTEVNVSVGGTD